MRKKSWSQQAHEVWQIDGKEGIQLGNGQSLSWMNVVDEATTTPLGTKLFEVPFVTQIDICDAIRSVNQRFTRWGLPRKIKIDNGLPFVFPRVRDVPSLAVLWWIGLGIEVVYNTPRCPQQNGGVECSQGILSRWSNPSGYANLKGLQQRIDEEVDFQYTAFQMRNKGNQTRQELHPELATNLRKYNTADFDLRRVDDWLAQQVWTRRVRQSGEIKMFGSLIYVSQKYKHQQVDVTFDPIERRWLIYLQRGTLVQQSSRGVPEKDTITGPILAQ